MDRNTSIVIGVAVLIVAGAVAAGDMFSPRDTTEPDRAGDGAKGLLYRVDGGANDVYLFGSIHFGRDDMYPLDDTVEDAFRDADVLVMEIDMSNQTQRDIDRRMAAMGTYDDRRMSEVVSNDTFTAVYSILSRHGHDRASVDRMKPWYAANTISKATMEVAGYDPDRGSEEYFTKQAEERGMTMAGMETVADQASAFDTMSDDAQELYVQGAITGYNTGGAALDAMARDWMTGSTSAFVKRRQIMQSPSQTPSMDAFHTALLDEREDRMTDQVTNYLEDDGNTTFVVVGALHLTGESSIPDNLEDAGYTVTDMYAADQ